MQWYGHEGWSHPPSRFWKVHKCVEEWFGIWTRGCIKKGLCLEVKVDLLQICPTLFPDIYIYKSIDVVVISIIFIFIIMGYECSIYMGKNKNLAYSISSQLNAWRPVIGCQYRCPHVALKRCISNLTDQHHLPYHRINGTLKLARLKYINVNNVCRFVTCTLRSSPSRLCQCQVPQQTIAMW